MASDKRPAVEDGLFRAPTADSLAAEDRGAKGNLESYAKRDTSYRSVASRISGWTTNLLATSVVLLIALVFGRKLVQLWRPPAAAPEKDTPQQLVAFDDPLTPLRLEFGHSPIIMHRQPFLGSTQDAVEQLCSSCSNQLESSLAPTGKVSPAESMLLRRLAGRSPRHDSPPKTGLYQLDEALPIVVGTKQVARSDGVRDNGTMRRRVVTWGIAVPAADNRWTLFSFSHGRGVAAADFSDGESAGIALPPTTVHLMTIRWPGGGGVTAFNGDDRPEEWAKFYDNWFDNLGIRRDAPWRKGDRWHVRYLNRRKGKVVNYDIQFTRDASQTPDTRWRGMITETTTNLDRDD